MNGYWGLLSRQWPLLGFGFLTVFWGNLGQSFFISWFGAGIQLSFALSATDYGLLYAVATLGSSFMIMALGGHIDRLPLAHFTALVACGLMVACLLMAWADSLILFAISLFLLRLFGQGLMPHTAQSTMARYFGEHRGKALSISASGVPVGEVLLPSLVVMLVAVAGWQHSWFWLAISIPLIYGPLITLLLYKSSFELSSSAALSNVQQPVFSRRHLLSDRRFWLILPALLTGPFMLTGLFIQQNYLLTQKNWSEALLATGFIFYGFMHWLSAVWVGAMVDRYSARRLVPFVLLPLVVALLMLSCGSGPWLAPFFMSVLGLAIGVAHPVFSALWAEIYGISNIGAIRSLATSVMMIATAISPWVFGYFIDSGMAGTQLFSILTISALFAAITGWFAFPPSTKTPAS